MVQAGAAFKSTVTTDEYHQPGNADFIEKRDDSLQTEGLSQAMLNRQNKVISKKFSLQAFLSFVRASLGGRSFSSKPRIAALNFASWKRDIFRKALAEFDVKFIRLRDGEDSISHAHSKRGFEAIVIWGYPNLDWVDDTAKRLGIPIWRIEDGFLRSVGLGANHVAPLSYCIDRTGLYFDPRFPSDLENTLLTYDFDANPALMERARNLIGHMISQGISKYNGMPAASIDIARPYVLVLGQCEDDASIRLGASPEWTNQALAELAIRENPGVPILFRPHPDIAAGRRKRLSDPESLAPALKVISGDIALGSALAGAAKVYTITSLAGFEAVLRGIPTVVTGMPFYAGWGLTDDRSLCFRRTRKLTAEEVFAAAYLLYTKYFDPTTGKALTAEDVAERLASADPGLKVQTPVARPVKASVKKPVQAKAVPKTKPVATPLKASVKKPVQAKAVPKTKPGAISNNRRQFSRDPEWYVKLPPKTWDDNRRPFLFMPWIPEHGQAIISRLSAAGVDMESIDVLDRPFDPDTRNKVSKLAREQPELWRRLLLRRLIPVAGRASGLIVTFDWHPVMRELVHAARSLGLPSVLVPHESIFLDESLYYAMPQTGVRVPTTDHALVWGELQQCIFKARGFPQHRLRITGTPKLDHIAQYRPRLGRAAFACAFGLNADRPIILFAAQPMDMQTVNREEALQIQERAIFDCLDYAEARGAQLLLRQPPSALTMDAGKVEQRLTESPAAAIDGPSSFLVDAAEAVHHANVIISVNSTMLIEAALAGRPAISAAYLGGGTPVRRAGIPIAAEREELHAGLDAALGPNPPRPSLDGMAWAARALSVGCFDDGAAGRIAQELARIAALPTQEACRLDRALEIIQDPMAAGNIVHIPPTDALKHTLAHLPGLLSAAGLITEETTAKAQGADVFAQWGITPSNKKKHADSIRRSLGRPKIILEDGFIRSLGLGLSKEPALSILMDDVTAYYDAKTPSRLCQRLNGPRELTVEERDRARAAIQLIVANRISKYNHAPIVPLAIGQPDRRKILLVDQRFGDQSVISGLADERSFMRMLVETITENPDAEILLKRHPDAIGGGKDAYFSDSRIGFTRSMPNVHLIDFDINPYCLFDLVDEVRVVTSGLGFEALMAGLPVCCYGAPFYAGWGLTGDRIDVPHRTRARTCEDLFHAAYIEFSRYWQPEFSRRCEVEEVVELLIRRRDAVAGVSSTQSIPSGKSQVFAKDSAESATPVAAQ